MTCEKDGRESLHNAMKIIDLAFNCMRLASHYHDSDANINT